MQNVISVLNSDAGNVTMSARRQLNTEHQLGVRWPDNLSSIFKGNENFPFIATYSPTTEIPHQTCYPLGTRVYFPEAKQPWPDTNIHFDCNSMEHSLLTKLTLPHPNSKHPLLVLILS